MLTIIKATYGVIYNPTKSVDVTDLVTSLVSQDKLAVTVSNDTFPDPAPGRNKQLRVDYSLDGVTKSKTIDEGEILEL